MISLLVAAMAINRTDPIPKPSSGKIVRLTDFVSELLPGRAVDVWLPTHYDGKKKFAVLFMHDGQMLFDKSIAWNKQEWKVDETLTALHRQKRIRDTIVVGVWNAGPQRWSEYVPGRPFSTLPQEEQARLKQENASEGIGSDRYVQYLVEELKPYVDKMFKTEPAAAYLAGSSMGGLISMYAMCEQPGIFVGAACLSTHWPGSSDIEDSRLTDAFVTYLKENLPPKKRHRIYFDYGDQTLDASYAAGQARADAVMRNAGWGDDRWLTMFFPGAAHDEASWSKRLAIPLEFILQKPG